MGDSLRESKEVNATFRCRGYGDVDVSRDILGRPRQYVGDGGVLCEFLRRESVQIRGRHGIPFFERRVRGGCPIAG